MMEQYMEVKEQCQDKILFFRLGDFYEMFFDDALTASRELDLTLTGRAGGNKEKNSDVRRPLPFGRVLYRALGP